MRDLTAELKTIGHHKQNTQRAEWKFQSPKGDHLLFWKALEVDVLAY